MPLTIPTLAYWRSNMKVRKIKQRQLTLFKRHAFKRFLAKIDAGGYTAYDWRDDSFWEEAK